MAHLTTPKKPHSDFASAKEPQHDMPYAWLGDPRCTRCHKTLAQIEAGAPCLTDEQIRDARTMGGILKGMRAAR